MPPRRRSTSRKRAPAKRAPATPTTAPVVGPGERLFVLDVPFEERGVAAANGARWDPHLRHTIYVGGVLPRNLTPYAALDYSWERWVEDDYNGAVLTPTLTSAPMTPRPHQVEAIDRIEAIALAGYRGFLEADDVGLGKTISAWVGALRVAQHRRGTRILIMCPKGVIPHWRRTIAALGDGGARICVINYDRAKKLLATPTSAQNAVRTRTKNKNIAKSGTSLVDWDIVIADESHKLKNQSAQRTQAFARLARYVAAAKDAPFVIWMSATAGQNPTELAYLAPLLAQLTGAKKSELADFGQWLADQGFAVTYNARFKKWEWGVVPDGATTAEIRAIEAAKDHDLARIRTLLFDGPKAPSIRRLPENIANWPTVLRILWPVELDLGERHLYEQVWTQFRADMNLSRRGRDPMREGFAARLRFRQKASLIRVPGTVDLIHDMLDNGHQVVVSVEFHESLDAIRDALTAAKVPVATFTGRNTSEREDERVAFQRGHRKVMLFTVAEAISLHQKELLQDGTLASDVPRTTIVHDPRYSGLESIQIEGRAHRDGQAANVYYPFAGNTVEEKIVKTLVDRIRTTKEMAGDDVTAVRELQDLLDAASLTDDPFDDTGDSTPPASLPTRPPGIPAVSPAATPGRGSQPPSSRPPRLPTQPAARPARPARADTTMTPEERAFREAMAGRKAAAAPQRAPTAAERASFRDGLRER